jgi:hypothetical protein
VYQPPRKLTEAFIAVYQRVVPESPFNLNAMRQPVDAYRAMVDVGVRGMRAAGCFGEPEQWRFDWEQACTREEWLDELRTLGPLSRLGPDELGEVLGEVGAAVDELGGSFTMAYATVVVTSARSGGPR